MYLAFKSLEISSELSQHLSKSEKESTNDAFGGSNARTNVCVMCVEVEIHE